jgi:hypothetical protein
MFYHITKDLQIVCTEEKVSLDYAAEQNWLFVNFDDCDTAKDVAESGKR